MDNKSKIDRIHDLLPSHFNSKTNINWSALIDAVGASDQLTADLIEQVKEQFFIATSSRPYIDTLAANVNVSRPKLIGMDDTSFRQYIPVLSYKPKQVKLIIDQLLDVFFFKESTTAFITSSAAAPFTLADGWELDYIADELNAEHIVFNAQDFTDISNATANEIVASINRQTNYSYATAYYDSVTKNTFIRIFTNTVGSKGSLRLLGGRANIALQLNGFLSNAGTGSNTTWSVTKVGDTVTFQYVSGGSPGLNFLQVDDIIIIDLAGNVGSFTITNVDLTDNLIEFHNLFGTPGTFTQTSAAQVKFIRPQKYVAYTNNRRAMTWETKSGEIVVEMPVSPPVVKRSLKGSAHINGAFANMTNLVDSNTVTVDDASKFPDSGTFWLQSVNAIENRILTPSEDTVVTTTANTRLQGQLQRYAYTSRTFLTTTGDTQIASLQITNLASTAGLAIGNSINVAGIPAYATIIGIVGSTVTSSHPATANGTAITVSFGGNTLTGISPNLPDTASLNSFTLNNIIRASGVVTATTTVPHNYRVGDTVIISGSSGINQLVVSGDITNNSNTITNLSDTTGLSDGLLVIGPGIPANDTVTEISGNTAVLVNPATASSTGSSIQFNESLNGSFIITSVTSNTFTFIKGGSNGNASIPGNSRVEREGMAASGSKLILTNSISNSVSRITGTYVWDTNAAFVLSSNTTTTVDSIDAGKIVRLLNVNPNTIPSTGGFVMFDYGLNTQEGPVRYLYTPSNSTIAIDPSYTFQYSHPTGSAVVALSKKGPHIMSGLGNEYAPYITNPSEARAALEALIESVKSAGIFVNFLIKYPEQLYATLDVYQSGQTPSF